MLVQRFLKYASLCICIEPISEQSIGQDSQFSDDWFEPWFLNLTSKDCSRGDEDYSWKKGQFLTWTTHASEQSNRQSGPAKKRTLGLSFWEILGYGEKVDYLLKIKLETDSDQ